MSINQQIRNKNKDMRNKAEIMPREVKFCYLFEGVSTSKE